MDNAHAETAKQLKASTVQCPASESAPAGESAQAARHGAEAKEEGLLQERGGGSASIHIAHQVILVTDRLVFEDLKAAAAGALDVYMPPLCGGRAGEERACTGNKVALDACFLARAVWAGGCEAFI